jgi:hypothetical protein
LIFPTSPPPFPPNTTPTQKNEKIHFKHIPILWVEGNGSGLIHALPEQDFPVRSIQIADFNAVGLRVGPVQLLPQPIARQSVRGDYSRGYHTDACLGAAYKRYGKRLWLLQQSRQTEKNFPDVSTEKSNLANKNLFENDDDDDDDGDDNDFDVDDDNNGDDVVDNDDDDNDDDD